MLFTNRNLTKRSKPAKHMALAIALATGSVVAMAGMAEPAFAQKKKKKEKKDYSKEFIEVYNPINEALKAEGNDPASVKPSLPGLIAVATTADDRFVTGNTVYSVGLSTSDRDLQLQGMKIMLASEKVPLEQLGQFNFIAFQLTRNLEQHDASREYLKQAINYNFTTDTINPAALQVELSETYFRADRNREGLVELQNAIDARKASGLAIEEAWYRRGLSVSFNNKLQPEVYNFLSSWIAAYPKTSNWRDAINITRQLNEFNANETLDIMRLGFRLGTMQDSIEYLDYVESADPRRLPKEVQTVIQAGYDSGIVSRNDIYIADSLKAAASRISADRADLPSLERDAGKAGARLATVMAAGDAFLSYGQASKAETFYTKALDMPGVNAGMALTRLGISQTELGNYAGAKETFTRVQGKRSSIAKLWMAYADSKLAPPAPAAAPTVPAAESAS